MIHYARQDISQADIDSVIKVLRSDFLTQGQSVDQFELAVADYCGVGGRATGPERVGLRTA